ncbi:MAG: hypothetical protein AB1454_11165 [Candidatus Auribacterota bacterium]
MKSACTILSRVLPGALYVWFALAGVVFILTSVKTIFFPFALEQNEGVVLYVTRLIQEGTLPYMHLTHPPYFINNYPPVYNVLCAVTGYLFSYPLASGRLISTLSLLGTAIICGLMTYRLARSYMWGIICGGFFLTLPMILWQCRYYRVDALGVFFSISAVFAILLIDKKQVPVVVSALLCALGVFTKHSMLAAPLAIGTVLFLYRHQYKWLFTCIFLAAVTVPAVILQIVSHGEFLRHLFVYTVTGLCTPDIKRHVMPLISLIIWYAGAMVFCLTRRNKSAWTMNTALIFIYGLLSLNGVLLIFKEGASNMYLIEAVAATIVMGGYAWRSLIQDNRWKNTAACAVFATVLLSAMMPWFIGSAPYYRIAMGYGTFLSELYSREKEIYLKVKSAQGRVLCENISYPALCGKDPEWVAFMTKQLHNRGINSDDAIRSLIRSKEFALIVLESALRVENNRVIVSAAQLSQLTPGIMQDTLQNYYMRAGESYVPATPGRYVKQKTILYPR